MCLLNKSMYFVLNIIIIFSLNLLGFFCIGFWTRQIISSLFFIKLLLCRTLKFAFDNSNIWSLEGCINFCGLFFSPNSYSLWCVSLCTCLSSTYLFIYYKLLTFWKIIYLRSLMFSMNMIHTQRICIFPLKTWGHLVIDHIFFFFLFFFFFRAAPTAYKGSQARSPIGATTASLHQRHSNSGSELHLRPIPQLTAMSDP